MVDRIKKIGAVDRRPSLDIENLGLISATVEGSGPDLELRKRALESYLGSDLPDRVSHLWRFTDPGHLWPASLDAAALKGADPVDLKPVPGAAATVDLWPGRPPVVNRNNDVPDGTLAFAPEPATGGHAPGSLFGALNAAAWNAGLQVEVSPDADLPGPVHIRIHAAAEATLPRIRVDIGRGARATIVEEHRGGGEGVRVVGQTEITAGEGARVRHVVVQIWERGTSGHLGANGMGGRDANLMTVFGSFGGDRFKAELVTDLAGEGARSEMIGVALTGEGQFFDHHTYHRHSVGRTWSNIDFKAVAAEKSRSSYTGLIRIEEEAPHSEAFQENRNLLLSNQSRADAIPELEIHNEEVSCSHGATVAPVDRDQLFYLESRGLKPGSALSLVVRGFLENTLSRLPEDLRAEVEKSIEPRLNRVTGEAS